MKIEEDIWYGNHKAKWLLAPLGLLFGASTHVRRWLFAKGFKESKKVSVPVIVVGNITVGGTGKTPMVVFLCDSLIKAGYKPGIISRGYGSKAPHYPFTVTANSPVEHSGDEPFMLHNKTGCPLVISPTRSDAAEQLLSEFDVDVIITDDGLQHYALQRDIEIIVIDGKRRLGNGHLLPMGPLREGEWRLDSADFVVCNGGNAKASEYNMTLVPDTLKHVVDNRNAETIRGDFTAIAGIGNPQRFYNTLTEYNYNLLNTHSFPDHFPFSKQDIEKVSADTNVVMTEKDAVKCQSFALDNWFYLPVSARLDNAFLPKLLLRLKELQNDIGS